MRVVVYSLCMGSAGFVSSTAWVEGFEFPVRALGLGGSGSSLKGQ